MKTATSILGVLALGLVAQAAVVPHCKHCPQDACMDSIIKKECGKYLFVEETATGIKTVLETVTVAITPTEISSLTFSKTVINDVTTTVPVLATVTVDYTFTITQDVTATNTVTETETVTVEGEAPITTMAPLRRAVNVPDWILPEYATAACGDIEQYSSRCSCLGYKPSTSTLAAEKTTSTVTETLTGDPDVVFSTVETVHVTEPGTTVTVTTTVSTVIVSQAVETDTLVQTVATTDITETRTTTFTATPTVPAPAVTHTVRVTIPDEPGMFVENVNIPPGAHIGVIGTIRQTVIPATLAIKPDGIVQLLQTPMTHVPYNLYYYSNNNIGFSYVQVTSELVASIMGIAALLCELDANDQLHCYHEGNPVQFWLCGRHWGVTFGPTSHVPPAQQCSGSMNIRTISLSGIHV